MKIEKSYISSDEYELLIAFEQGKSIENSAEILNKDQSGVSRQLKKLSEKLDGVLIKEEGRWVLTDLGHELARAAKDFIQLQKSIIKRKKIITIGTNQEFSTRILIPKLRELQSVFGDISISIKTFSEGVERALLSGEIDIGIDCDRPFSPLISFLPTLKEIFVFVCSKDFYKMSIVKTKKGDWSDTSYVRCDRLHPFLPKEILAPKTTICFNDIASTRSACIEGVGWSFLPKYAVQKELDSKELIKVSNNEVVAKTKYGVWWPRDKKRLKTEALLLKEWLQTCSLI